MYNDKELKGKYCATCKIITDRLYQAAKVKGRTEYLSAQLATMKTAVAMLDAYREQNPEIGKKSGKKTGPGVTGDSPHQLTMYEAEQLPAFPP